MFSYWIRKIGTIYCEVWLTATALTKGELSSMFSHWVRNIGTIYCEVWLTAIVLTKVKALDTSFSFPIAAGCHAFQVVFLVSSEWFFLDSLDVMTW